jgi:outer membrane protein insertion porin family
MGMFFKGLCFVLMCVIYVSAGQRISHVQYGDLRDTYLSNLLENTFKYVVYNPKTVASFVKFHRLKGIYHTFDVDFDSKSETLIFNIKENARIRAIKIDCPEVCTADIIAGLKTRVGRPYNYFHIDADVKYINNYLKIQGYGLSSVRDVTLSDEGAVTFDVEFPLVDSIQFSGVRDTNDMVLYRELFSKPSKGIRQDLLEFDHMVLLSLPYYSSVSLPQFEYLSSENIRITYRVTEKKVNRLDVGIEELEKDQGVALFARATLNHMFIYSDFVLLQAQIGYLNQFDFRTYKLHYRQPWLFNRYHFQMDTSVYTSYRSELYQNNSTVYDTVRTGARFFLVRPLRQLFLKAGAGVYSDSVYPQDGSDFSSYQINALSIYLEYLNINQPLNPSQGIQSRLTLERAGDIFGQSFGGIDFMRLSYFYTQYVPMSSSTTLAYRFFSGYYRKASSTETFETEKFSLGGANTLRGYRDLSYFGNYRLSINIEPRFQLSDSLVGVVFLDAGYIVDSLSNINSKNLLTGYGVGVRFLNTFIPIRLDAACGDEFMLHLSIAHTF